MSAVITDAEISTPPEDSGYIDDFGPLPKSPSTQATFVVFDDFVAGTGTVTVGSNDLLNGVLGAFDQMAIQVVTDRVQGTSSITLSTQIFHSGDGRGFVAKAALPEILAIQVSTAAPTSFPVGYDDGTIPSLAFVALRFVFVSSSFFKGKLKCTVTCNNTHERSFDRKVLRRITGGNCTSWMNAGDVLTVVAHEGGEEYSTSNPLINKIYWRLPSGGFKSDPSPRQHFISDLLGCFDPDSKSVAAERSKIVEPYGTRLVPSGTYRVRLGFRVCFRAGPSLVVLAQNVFTGDKHPVAPNVDNPGDTREAHYMVVFDSTDYMGHGVDKKVMEI